MLGRLVLVFLFALAVVAPVSGRAMSCAKPDDIATGVTTGDTVDGSCAGLRLPHGVSDVKVTIQAERSKDASLCRLLSNAHAKNDYFVPSRRLEEWEAFLKAVEVKNVQGVTAKDCP